MDIVFSTANLGKAFLLMLLGMVGIFVVMLVIMLAVKLLARFTRDSVSKDNNK